MKKEFWRTHPEFTQYDVSTLGRVRRNCPNENGRYPAGFLLSAYESRLSNNSEQYLCVRLTKNGKVRNCYVHRLVAETFLASEKFEGAEVRHLDCDSKNNCLTNLKWGTAVENAQDTLLNGRRATGKAWMRIYEKVHCKRPRKKQGELAECS